MAEEPTGITKQQFFRGFKALTDYRVIVDDIVVVKQRAGFINADVPEEGDILESELIRQLEERCGDGHDESSVIASLHYNGVARIWLDAQPTGNVVWLYKEDEPDEPKTISLENPVEVWAFWRRTKTGPFSGEASGG